MKRKAEVDLSYRGTCGSGVHDLLKKAMTVLTITDS